jgi:hypothetical protein
VSDEVSVMTFAEFIEPLYYQRDRNGNAIAQRRWQLLTREERRSQQRRRRAALQPAEHPPEVADAPRELDG